MSRLDDNLDRDLKDAFRRQDPPAGFEARVLARAAAAQSAPRPARWFQLPVLRFAAAAAICLAVFAGVRFEQDRRLRIQGEAAKRDLIVALRVTGSKLQAVNQRVREWSEDRSDMR